MIVLHHSSDSSAAGMHPSLSAVRLRGATKRFVGLGKKEVLTALDSIDLDVEESSCVALIGSNGAGKSTLLSILMGTLLLDEGVLQLDHQDVGEQPSWKRADKIALVRQNPEHNVLSALSIEENFALAIMGRERAFGLRRYDRDAVRHAATQALAKFGMGIESRLSEAAGTLSGGQRQAVAVAMAAVRNPRLLLLDEHVSALDPKRAKVVAEVTEDIVRAQSITTVMVTHDLSHALKHSDRVLMMHRGRIVMDLSGDEKNAIGFTELASRFEHLVGEALPDRTLLAV
ncbi:ATP-binding cassette domain-containing protein [Mesorhizobium qingshengii]|jgi:putative ABC transport system ATP-binding protein|uniref:ATP-binding cassette domain-containing protein n=1 Tax=Mesorhizobium qingshengii TaxID=1165689 RepID=A0ABT4QY42_9HYPH|nr:ATP-binding cassette domain-containing protein [Mesorhizobium qingshengii]MCZ8546502.1 ATP-binding cassette domain-containing protein [Mesorhizobium qingshengii]